MPPLPSRPMMRYLPSMLPTRGSRTESTPEPLPARVSDIDSDGFVEEDAAAAASELSRTLCDLAIPRAPLTRRARPSFIAHHGGRRKCTRRRIGPLYPSI